MRQMRGKRESRCSWPFNWLWGWFALQHLTAWSPRIGVLWSKPRPSHYTPDFLPSSPNALPTHRPSAAVVISSSSPMLDSKPLGTGLP